MVIPIPIPIPNRILIRRNRAGTEVKMQIPRGDRCSGPTQLKMKMKSKNRGRERSQEFPPMGSGAHPRPPEQADVAVP